MTVKAMREHVFRACNSDKNAFGPACWLYFAVYVCRLGFAGGRDWLPQRVKNDGAALIPPARVIIEKEYRQAAEFLKL